MAQYILSIDQGTTGSTVALVSSRGQLLTSVNHEFPQIYPRPGWVEHHPEAAIGITNQRETAVLWHRKTSEPLYNAIVWQCRRTTDVCESLKKSGAEALVRRRTGLVLDPYFSASKFAWLLNKAPRARTLHRRGHVLGGTIDS